MVHQSKELTVQQLGPKPVRSYADDNLLLAEKFSQWLAIQDYSPHTRRAYSDLIVDFCWFIGPRSLAQIKHLDIRRYFAFLQNRRGVGERTIDQKLYCLRAFFEFLTLGGVVPTNIARFVHTRRRHRNLPRVPSVEEVRKLIAAAKSPRDRALIEVCYSSGCRVAEVSGMRCEDADFSDPKCGSIRVLGKGRKERTAFIGKMAMAALLAHLGKRREGYLFQSDRPRQKYFLGTGKPNKNESGVWWRGSWREYPDESGPGIQHFKWLGRIPTMSRDEARDKLATLLLFANTTPPERDLPLGTRQIARIVKRAALRAGLKGLHPHSLRHAFATHLLADGANIRGIQELLGHASLSDTMQYTQLAPTQLLEIHKKYHPRK